MFFGNHLVEAFTEIGPQSGIVWESGFERQSQVVANRTTMSLRFSVLAVTAMPEKIAETLLHGISVCVRDRFYLQLVKKGEDHRSRCTRCASEPDIQALRSIGHYGLFAAIGATAASCVLARIAPIRTAQSCSPLGKPVAAVRPVRPAIRCECKTEGVRTHTTRTKLPFEASFPTAGLANTDLRKSRLAVLENASFTLLACLAKA